MSKYGESIGVWELMVGRTESMGPLVLKPIVMDHKKLISLMTNAKTKSNDWFLNGCFDLLKSIIIRDYPPLNSDEEKELDEFVQFNLTELVQELQIKFRLIKREDIAKLKQKIIQEGNMKV